MSDISSNLLPLRNLNQLHFAFEVDSTPKALHQYSQSNHLRNISGAMQFLRDQSRVNTVASIVTLSTSLDLSYSLLPSSLSLLHLPGKAVLSLHPYSLLTFPLSKVGTCLGALTDQENSHKGVALISGVGSQLPLHI